jgi:hypothetical protein
VIVMLVGDEDRGQRFGFDTGGVEALEGLLAAEPGVDQDGGAFGRDERGVPGA